MRASWLKLLFILLVALLILTTLAEGKKSKKKKTPKNKNKAAPWIQPRSREPKGGPKAESRSAKGNETEVDDRDKKDNSTKEHGRGSRGCHSDHSRHSVQRKSNPVHVHVHGGVMPHRSPHHPGYHGSHDYSGRHGHGRSMRGSSKSRYGRSRSRRGSRRSRRDHSRHYGMDRSPSGRRYGSKGSKSSSRSRSDSDRSRKGSPHFRFGHDNTRRSFHHTGSGHRRDYDRSRGSHGHGSRSHGGHMGRGGHMGHMGRGDRSCGSRRGHGHGHGSWDASPETHVHIHVTVEEKDRRGRPDKSPSKDEFMYFRCDFRANNPDDDVSGTILLRQKPWSRILEVRVNISGIDSQPNAPADSSSLHGLHVHEFGDFSNGCLSFGGHFNPEGTDHAGPQNGTRHVGDWGNLEVDSHGNANTYLNFTDTSVLGPKSLIGRGIVLHAGQDDLGQGGTEASRTTGSAGGRLACCIISRTKSLADEDW